ncbi:hypothetical protein BHE74_00033043 [Ensete ventricosum]|nr:hypothetical protein BHE74_00033043 [Ensete ventricosum]RZR93108.1 hypothetical protein BHM03_00021535 [Ensete ventricosum]
MCGGATEISPKRRRRRGAMAADEEETGKRHWRRSDDGGDSGAIANGVRSPAGSRRGGGWGGKRKGGSADCHQHMPQHTQATEGGPRTRLQINLMASLFYARPSHAKLLEGDDQEKR